MANRYDNKHRKLKQGESQRSNGYYTYRWTTRDGKRHSISATSLDALREKEDSITKDRVEGIKQCASNVTLNDIFELWKRNKRGLKDNTLQNYVWCYKQYVYDDPIGEIPIQKLRRSDVKSLYNKLYDERNLKIATIDNVHTVLHQVVQTAVDDDYIRKNITDNLLKELKRTHNVGDSHKRALTVDEQNLFLDYLKSDNCKYNNWYNIFAIMAGTGLRCGELVGLRWCDIDLTNEVIDVNHTLVFYNHNVSEYIKNKCYFSVNTPKTKAGTRKVLMQDFVKEAFIKEKEYQERNGIKCEASIDGYTDFIFVNRFGNCQHQGTLNKALKRIIRDCNEKQLEKSGKDPVMLPNFSCHSLRHTFITRLIEAGVNPKVVQELAGHSRVDITLDVYTTVSEEFKKREFDAVRDILNPKNNDEGEE